jgi:hypothetical protein
MGAAGFVLFGAWRAFDGSLFGFPDGPWHPPGGRGGKMTFRIEPPVSPAGERRTFEIYREGWGHVIDLLRSTREQAEKEVERLKAEEVWAHEAFNDPDPSTLCEAGWHRAFDRAGTRYFFRLRRGWGGCALAYHVAWVPIEYRGRTIGTFNVNAIPWLCEACGESVGASEGSYEVSPGRAQSDESNLDGYWQL